MSFEVKLLYGVLIVFGVHAMVTLQNPVAHNYTTNVLRLAKVAQLKAYMDNENNACENFYEHACGKWKRLQPANSYKTKTSYLDQLNDIYIRKSIELLNGGLARDVILQQGDAEVDGILKNFYASCRHQQGQHQQQQLNLEPILKVVDFKGGWPTVTSASWYEYEYDWLKVIAHMKHILGVDILIGLDVIPDYKEKDNYRIKVGAPKLTLGSKDKYLSGDYHTERKNYKQRIETKLNKYFPKMSNEWATEIANQVLHVEKQLAKGLPDNAKLRLEQTTRERYVNDLKLAYGSFVDLSRYMQLIFDQTIYTPVYETPEDYLSNLMDVIKQTPKLTIANYTMWRVLEKFDFAGDEKWCMQKIIEYFPYQLESMFHRNYNSMQMVNELRSVWFDIKETFRKELHDGSQHLNWMTAETREKAIVKLKEMDLQILTHQDENKKFKDRAVGVLKLHKDKYYENTIDILQFHTKQQLAKLIEKQETHENDISLPKYKHTTNKILIPITFLQTRFFWDVAYPLALKYSSMGFLLAQQMLNGFDNIGCKYDNHGYHRSWCDETTQRGYEDISMCFEKKSYKFHGHVVNDAKALEKSVIDSGGLAISYRAYQKWWDNESKLANETLPSFDHTPNQTFFIGFAQLWCAEYDDSIEDFTELPEALRVNNALMNLKTFASDMKCEKGEPMTQKHKCILF